jgi:uroporphyrinogen-III synthase
MSITDSKQPVSSTALSGWSVLVTRPREQAASLCQMIENSGGKAVRFPVIEILPGRDQPLIRQMIGRLGQFDIAIFISSNAVRFTMELLHDQNNRPPGLHIAAIGPATAVALEQSGWSADLVPESAFNSEALLAMPQLQNMSGRKIIIFRGEGGRELLGDTLVRRGAQVVYADVYRRAVPKSDNKKLLQPWMQAQNSAVIITSQEGLDNLVTLLDAEARKRLRQTPMIVISERMLDKTRQHGIQAPVMIAKQASDEAILKALFELSRKQGSGV